MNVLNAFRIALNALVIHKGRSALTSLGIIIGTGAVISMVSAAGGARTKLDERLDNVGKTLIIIRAGARTQNGTLADIKQIGRASCRERVWMSEVPGAVYIPL